MRLYSQTKSSMNEILNIVFLLFMSFNFMLKIVGLTYGLMFQLNLKLFNDTFLRVYCICEEL